MKEKKSTTSKPKPETKPNTITKKRQIIYYLILILISLFILVVFELSLRWFNYGYNLSLTVKSKLYPGYYEINKNVGKRYFTKLFQPEISKDIFLINKPDNCYRIFVMGCSTTQGFPYQKGTTFSRILNYRLQDAFPQKRIEVVNISMSAINSYAMEDLINEVVQNKPDAILIYTGHNEYYGALGISSVENGGNVRWIKKLRLRLIHLRTYQLVQNIVYGTSQMIAAEETESGTLMERIAEKKAVEYGSKDYYAGIDQFRINMLKVIEKAKSKDIPIILSELVCNIRDQKPFKSIKTAINPGADDFYAEAQQLEARESYGEARNNYYKAKDYDAIRFRAPEMFNNVLIELGEKYDVPIVPMKFYFEKQSPNGLIGNNLMLEHLHPNIDGYFLMADAFFKTMRKEKLISAIWDTTLIKSSDYYRNNWGFTALDSLYADIKIKSLKSRWPFQKEANGNKFIETYLPSSYEDSAAFNCVIYGKHIEDEHEKLAKRYAKKGNYIGAFKEYYSLIKSYPYITSLYFDALDYLIAGKDYNKAKDLLLSMPGLDTNYYALSQLGNIYLILNKPGNAINSFNAARKNSTPNDNLEHLLFGLYTAYKATGNKEKEEQILAEIRIINPKFNQDNKNQSNETLNRDVQELIDQATLLLNAGKKDDALIFLKKTLKINETCLANKMIGSILYLKKDPEALYYFERAYKEDPKDQEVLTNLFILYLLKKDIRKASQILNELKQVSIDSDKINKFSKALENEKNKLK